MELIQRSMPPRADLREMLRRHVVARSLACMAQADERRQAAMATGGDFAAYQQAVRRAVRQFYGSLPAGPQAPPPQATLVSRFVQDGFVLENVLFDSFPGWQVNATVYVPSDFHPPYPAVVVPVGHSGKQFASYQLPCQYFARSGWLAICFDPPGQAGEKQPGNDHFRDGVRDYLVGATSSRYFVADALRCIDYLATRPDAELSGGVAMTGVSGGGTTTTFAAQLDERIAVIGPSCCVTPLADLDIAQCYSGCPETHPWRRYAEGVDEVDLLCAAAPIPCLLMAGEADEVFRIGDTRRLADVAARSYACVGAAERFAFFVDPGGHAYSLTQAREFVRFAGRWLGQTSDNPPELADDRFSLLPKERLQCRPSTAVSMRTRALDEADELAAQWALEPEAIRQAAANVCGVNGPAPVPQVESGEPFPVWMHDWRALMLRPEADIELPATLLTARQGLPAPTLLHLDDEGRHRLLHRQGLLTSAIRFLDRERQGFNLLTVDLRGWGDSAPAMFPYELAGWGSVDRYLAYATAALGDPIMAMRIRDGLAVLNWLRTCPEVDPARLVITGCGLGAMVALHVAAIDGQLAGVVTWDGLSSWRSLLAAEQYPWTADAFLPQALRYYDLPELTAALGCPVALYSLRAGTGEPAPPGELARYAAAVEATAEAEPRRLIAAIQGMLEGKGAAE